MADLSLTPEIGQWRKVLPFWVSYLLFPLIWASAILGRLVGIACPGAGLVFVLTA
jgi:hypothetical protein